MGLKSQSDFDIRTKLLSKLDTEADTLTLDALSKECQRLINLKADTNLVENLKGEVQVRRLHSSNAKKKSLPKTPCWFCGAMHYSRECTYSKHKCEQCNTVGHKEGYCYSKKNGQNSKQKRNNKGKGSHLQSKSIFVSNKIESAQRKYVSVLINGTKLDLQFDTASDITIISESNFQKLNVSNTSAVEQSARSATGATLPLSLQFDCNVELKQQRAELTCFVTPIKNLNVLGLDWITAFNLDNMSINAICNMLAMENRGSVTPNMQSQNISLLKQSFPDVFDEKLGLCNKTKAHLVVKPDHKPIFRPKRPVAYAIQHLVEEELQRLQDVNVISPVNYSEWAAPIVVTKKSNGSIRIYADFSTGLNTALETHQYPLPLPEDIFAKLANAKYFSHIDLSDAFLQIEVDESSKELLRINTHLGLFRYNRMIFGVKTFPAIFQQVMDKMLIGLEYAAAYIDDIFVSGRDQSEHDRNVHEVLRRSQDYGFKLKFAKCRFSVTEVRYLGYIISQYGLQPDTERVSAINGMPEPNNIAELRSFLGAIDFYGKFINKMRQLRGPFDELLNANTKWQWTQTHRKCFNSLKEILSSNLLLTHYDPQKKIIVAADASNYGLGACIMHEFPDGSVKAVSHASRSLTPSEKAYSQIEKERLALVFAVTKFHKMIFGRAFKLHTDHKPLLAIFDKLPVTHRMIKYESGKDKILKHIFDYVETGWPASNNGNVELQAFLNRKNEISIIDGCIIWGQRVVVPQVLRKRVLKQLHRGHPGIERTKAIARSFVYWPHIDSDIETLVRNCNNCASAAKMPTKSTLQPWPKPSAPWQRLHIDYAGPVNGYYFMVIIDAYSKWPEVIPTKSITTQPTVDILNEIFSRLGLPSTIVSDNGTQFTSAHFQQFLLENGITHYREIRRYFQTSSQKARRKGTTNRNLQVFLQCYRASPNKNNTDNKSPAEVLLGRNIRTNLDLLKPKALRDTQFELVHQKHRMKQQFDRKHGAKQKSFCSEDTVYACVHTNNNSFQWMPRKVVERVGKVMYNVLLDNQKLIRAHANQLRQRFCDSPEQSTKKEMNSSKMLIDAFGLYENEKNASVHCGSGSSRATLQPNNAPATQFEDNRDTLSNDNPLAQYEDNRATPTKRPQRLRRPVE
ncbi:uncharacterized protein K02A2.6-like, partial [Rhagoletis pomonella]|uniref:uncharacterized protein K02A2.6-like n=1 Tax=Rhagoletis pomonella TaxID=28610 RepID=UPI00177D5BCE